MVKVFKLTQYSMNKITSLLFIVSFLSFSCKNENTQKTQEELSEWGLAKLIEDNLIPPSFPERTFNILTFGALPDGLTNNSEAFKKAIQKCTEDGGGIVLVPKGTFLTGPIHLENKVNLHLEEGSEILFSTNPVDYYPLVHTSYEGMELMNYSPLIYAYKKKNIAVTGKGILNDQASNDNWFGCS